MFYNLIAQIKNAQMAKKPFIRAPFSKINFEIAKILVKFNFLKDAKKRSAGKKFFLDIELLYESGKPVITNFKFVSRPSRHVYFSYRQLRPVKQGLGMGVISTPKGLMTNNEARKNKVGGEYLFQVW